MLGYDNAHSQDHRHLQGKSYPYRFVSPADLVEDFLRDLREVRETGL
jgi:hypothetical protein